MEWRAWGQRSRIQGLRIYSFFAGIVSLKSPTFGLYLFTQARQGNTSSTCCASISLPGERRWVASWHKLALPAWPVLAIHLEFVYLTHCMP